MQSILHDFRLGGYRDSYSVPSEFSKGISRDDGNGGLGKGALIGLNVGVVFAHRRKEIISTLRSFNRGDESTMLKALKGALKFLDQDASIRFDNSLAVIFQKLHEKLTDRRCAGHAGVRSARPKGFEPLTF